MFTHLSHKDFEVEDLTMVYSQNFRSAFVTQLITMPLWCIAKQYHTKRNVHNIVQYLTKHHLKIPNQAVPFGCHFISNTLLVIHTKMVKHQHMTSLPCIRLQCSILKTTLILNLCYFSPCCHHDLLSCDYLC